MPARLIVSFTPDYIVPAAVTLRSILDSSPEGEFEVLCLVTEEIPQRQKEALSAMAGGRMQFRYMSLSGKLDGYYVDPRYSEAASYRLLLPELIPDADMMIYVDCDVVVRQDLARLYETVELGDKLLAAVYEAPIEGQAAVWEAMGCDPAGYFNSGLLVMNLGQMRKGGTSARLLDVLKTDYLEFPDQDALNIVCKGRVLPLPPVYNTIRTFLLPQYKADFVRQYSAEDWARVQDEGNIHYTGGKPWRLFTVKFGEWWRTYESLPPDIKNEWTPDRKVMRIWKVYRTFAGRRLIDTVQNIYRKVRY